MSLSIRGDSEDLTRSMSPKRFSLNRKAKSKERVRTPLDERMTSSSQRPQFAVSSNCANDFSASAEITMKQEITSPTQTGRRASGPNQRDVDVTKAHSFSPVLENTTPPSLPFFSPPNLSPFPTAQPLISVERKPENPAHTQALYPNCTPVYAPHFGGNFQGMPGMQPYNPYQGGIVNVEPPIGMENIPQNNHFVQAYMTPVQRHNFHIQARQPTEASYNKFTGYGQAFRHILWP